MEELTPEHRVLDDDIGFEPESPHPSVAAGQDEGMLVDHFPLFGLRLSTPRLELRLPSPEELSALAELAADGVHDPDVMPFSVPWTEGSPAEVARRVMQRHWKQLGEWTPQDWSLKLTAFRGGAVIGQQSIGASDLATTGEVRSGSWLGQRYQGRGFGTEMRAAVLHFAFNFLGAQEATSSAFADNAASRAVSAKFGYRPDGIHRRVVRGRLVVEQRFRLSREVWQGHRIVPVDVAGFGPCAEMLGVDS